MQRLLRRHTSRTVIWGGRTGDVQYGSKQFWRTHIPVDPEVEMLTLASSAYFDVGDTVDLAPFGDDSMSFSVPIRGIEGAVVGVAVPSHERWTFRSDEWL